MNVKNNITFILIYFCKNVDVAGMTSNVGGMAINCTPLLWMNKSSVNSVTLKFGIQPRTKIGQFIVTISPKSNIIF
jgi:hypothetical protein